MHLAKSIRFAVVVLFVAGYAVLTHYGTTTPAFSLRLALVIGLIVTSLLLLRVRFATVPYIRLFILVLFMAVIGLLWIFWPVIKYNFAWLYLAQHIVTNVTLALIFGLSLTPGQQPLITRLHVQVHGTFTPEIARYTRQVTTDWTVFFVAMALMSVTIFFTTSIVMWSLFANILSLPLAILMFASEYWLRLHRLPKEQHSFFDGIDVYLKISNAPLQTPN